MNRFFFIAFVSLFAAKLVCYVLKSLFVYFTVLFIFSLVSCDVHIFFLFCAGCYIIMWISVFRHKFRSYVCDIFDICILPSSFLHRVSADVPGVCISAHCVCRDAQGEWRMCTTFHTS